MIYNKITAVDTSKVISLNGDQDGVNKVFTTVEPFQSGSTTVYVNGLAYFQPADFSELDDHTIEFSTYLSEIVDDLKIEISPL